MLGPGVVAEEVREVWLGGDVGWGGGGDVYLGGSGGGERGVAGGDVGG